MKNISVIGCGTMGNGIAQTFAQYNYNIVLYDISKEALDKAMFVINKNLGRMARNRIIDNYPIKRRKKAFEKCFIQNKL